MTLSQLPPAEQLIPGTADPPYEGPVAHIEIVLDRSFESFTRSAQEELLSAIGKLLVVGGDVTVVRKTRTGALC